MNVPIPPEGSPPGSVPGPPPVSLGLGGLGLPDLQEGEVWTLLIKGVPEDATLSGNPDEARQIQYLGAGNWVIVNASLAEILFYPGTAELPLELEASFVMTGPDGTSRVDPRDLRVLVEGAATFVQSVQEDISEDLPPPLVEGIDLATGWGVTRTPGISEYDEAPALLDNALEGVSFAAGWGVDRPHDLDKAVVEAVDARALALGWGVDRLEAHEESQTPSIDGMDLAAGWGVDRAFAEPTPAAEIEGRDLALGWGVDRGQSLTEPEEGLSLFARGWGVGDQPGEVSQDIPETAQEIALSEDEPVFADGPETDGVRLALGWGVDRLVEDPAHEFASEIESLDGDEIALGWGVDRHARQPVSGAALALGWGLDRAQAVVQEDEQSAPESSPSPDPVPIDPPHDPTKPLASDEMPVFAEEPEVFRDRVMDDAWEGVVVTQGRPDAMAVSVLGQRWNIVLDDGRNAFETTPPPPGRDLDELMFGPREKDPWQLY